MITSDSFAKIDTRDIPKKIFEIPNKNGDGVFDIALWSIITWMFEWIQDFHNHVRKLDFRIKLITAEWIFIELINGHDKLYKLHYDTESKIYLIKNAYWLQKIRWIFTIESVSSIDNSVEIIQDPIPLVVNNTIARAHNAQSYEEEDWDILV